jgi:hypothetical protein
VKVDKQRELQRIKHSLLLKEKLLGRTNLLGTPVANPDLNGGSVSVTANSNNYKALLKRQLEISQQERDMKRQANIELRNHTLMEENARRQQRGRAANMITD